MTTSTQRTVVITGVGAERGIGRATAHRFARDGWAVVGLDLDGASRRETRRRTHRAVRGAGVRRPGRRRRRGLRAGACGTPCTLRTCPPSGRC